MIIPCGQNGSCPFLYTCSTAKNLCNHDPVFPLSGYEYGIFSLFPFFSALCNLSGNTFGQLKIILFMDLQNYQENQSTRLVYPLITGTALFNFFDLIFKRHPTKNTTLIDYNVVLLLIPNIILGSTIGALINNFIPPIVADSILVIIMILFSIKFYLRFKSIKNQQSSEIIQRKSQNMEMSRVESQKRQSQMNRQLITDLSSERRQTRSEGFNKKKKSLINQTVNISIQTKVDTQPVVSGQIVKRNQQLKKLQQYQATNHLPHILVTIAIFLVFQTFSFLAQGKIIFFTICSQPYHIAVPILAVLVIIFDVILCRYTKKRLEYYRQIGYQYSIKIDQTKYAVLLCFGSFFGGFNGGAFGVGNISTIIFTLIILEMEQAVISATIGYQIVFSGAASMAQALATKTLQPDVALLFFLETFILGGILTFFCRKFLFRFNKNKVNEVLVLISLSLVTTNIFAMITAIILGYKQFGAVNMNSSPFHC